MKYLLQGWVGEKHKVLPLTEQRFTEIRSDKDACLIAISLEEKLSLLLDNFNEWEVALLELGQASILWPRQKHSDAMRARLLLDRRMANLLTACRLYQDQSDHALSTLFGGSASSECVGIKGFKNKLYDTHSGYRFMEKLRNHVQHADLPVHAISYHLGNPKEYVIDGMEHVVTPLSSVKELQRGGAIKPELLKETSPIGKDIDLRPLAREYVQCFVELHREIVSVTDPRFKQARERYTAAVAELSVTEGQAMLFAEVVATADDGAEEEINLAVQFLEYFDELKFKNGSTHHLVSSFTSNHVAKPK